MDEENRHDGLMDNESRTLPFFGSMNLEILQASQTSIHGDIYYDLLVAEAGDPSRTSFMLRVARGVCATSPAPGTIVKASFLSGQVERLTPPN